MCENPELIEIENYIFALNADIAMNSRLRDANLQCKYNQTIVSSSPSSKKIEVFMAKMEKIDRSVLEYQLRHASEWNLSKNISRICHRLKGACIEENEMETAILMSSHFHRLVPEFKIEALKAFETVQNTDNFNLVLLRKLISHGIVSNEPGLKLLRNSIVNLPQTGMSGLLEMASFCQMCGEEYAGIHPMRISLLAEKYQKRLPSSGWLTAEFQHEWLEFLKREIAKRLADAIFMENIIEPSESAKRKTVMEAARKLYRCGLTEPSNALEGFYTILPAEIMTDEIDSARIWLGSFVLETYKPCLNESPNAGIIESFEAAMRHLFSCFHKTHSVDTVPEFLSANLDRYILENFEEGTSTMINCDEMQHYEFEKLIMQSEISVEVSTEDSRMSIEDSGTYCSTDHHENSFEFDTEEQTNMITESETSTNFYRLLPHFDGKTVDDEIIVLQQDPTIEKSPEKIAKPTASSGTNVPAVYSASDYIFEIDTEEETNKIENNSSTNENKTSTDVGLLTNCVELTGDDEIYKLIWPPHSPTEMNKTNSSSTVCSVSGFSFEMETEERTTVIPEDKRSSSTKANEKSTAIIELVHCNDIPDYDKIDALTIQSQTSKESNSELPTASSGTDSPTARHVFKNSDEAPKRKRKNFIPVIREFEPTAKLKEKVKRSVNSRSIRCHVPGCRVTFSKAFNLKRHLENVHNQKPEAFVCSLCRRKLSTEASVLRHYDAIHSVQINSSEVKKLEKTKRDRLASRHFLE